MLELVWRSARRGLRVLAVLAIALGVALGVAVSAIHRAALDEFEAGMRGVSGSADVEAVAPGGMDERLYPQLARLPDVAAASPVVEREVGVESQGRALRLRVVGIDLFRARDVQPTLLPPPDAAARLMEPSSLFLSPAAARVLGVRPGDGLDLLGHRFAVSGLLPAAGEGAVLAVADIAEVQWRLGTPGQLSRIALRLREGVSREAALQRVVAVLPPDVLLQTPDQALERADRLSRAYRVNLGLLALIALAVGSFLVAATQASAIARRASEIALMRALGMTRAQLMRLLVGEGVLQGAAGALLGILFGHGFAALVLRVMGADLGAGLVTGVAPELVFDAAASLQYGVLGMVAAAIGAAWPARDALAMMPARALRAGVFAPRVRLLGDRARRALLLVLTAAGVAAALAPPVAGLPLGGYVAIACALSLAILCIPWATAALTARLPEPASVPLALALHRLRAEPAFASRSAAGMLAATALMAAMAVMVTSFRSSVDRWLGDVLPAEFYVRGDRDRPWPHDVAGRLEQVPGVERVEPLRHRTLQLGPDLPAVALIARPVPEDAGRVLPRVGPLAPPTDLPRVWASEAMADLYGWRAGLQVDLPLAGRTVSVQVAGLWRDYARQHGAIVIDLAQYRQLTGDELTDDFAIWLRADADASAVAAGLRRASGRGDTLELSSSADIRRLSLGVFDRTFAATYALEAASALIGLAGIAAAFAASAAARIGEFGLLRHIGCTRRQIALQLAAEGLLTALPGLLLGLLAGFVMSALLIEVVNRQSFHWSMEWEVPWMLLLCIVLAMLTCSMSAALLGARQALGVQPVRAVRRGD
ncbi:FtsX-like permease family protein [Methyloversatilis thermotolerans]|uniref:FtsX-like permease family protein n=1 Tax=Methyloversatilis thermotolerans TaxID=1346290 RepID=UPI000368651E|nr:FtsX-like permease family protein [Methyloversatilis thermotolerans]